MIKTDPTALHTFDADLAAFAGEAVDYALRRTRHEMEPLGTPPPAAELRRALDGAISPAGMGLERAFALFTETLAPACQAVDHPRNLAFVPYAPAAAAVLFDIALSAAGFFGTSWIEAAGAVAAENQALRWLADLAGMPAGAGGVFLSGGTVANFTGLAVGRAAWRAKRGGGGRLAIATSREAHSSLHLAARVLDIDVVPVPGDDRGRLTGERLEEALATTDAEVFGVAATAGITNVGVVDELAGIAEVCTEHSLWLHVDAAYGGAALAVPSARPLFAGIEAADSLVIDPHKWLFAPLDCSALLYRDARLARAAFTQEAAYLAAFQEGDAWNPSDFGVHLTRRARGLPFWFLLAAVGTDAIAAAVEHSLILAREAARLIEQTPHLELVMEPELSVVVFRRRGWDAADYGAWSKRLLAEGTALVLPTVWHGESLLRLCFVNPRTTVADVRVILASLRGEV